MSSAIRGRLVSRLEASRGGGERLKSVCNHDIPVLTPQFKKNKQTCGLRSAAPFGCTWVRLQVSDGTHEKETAAVM